MDHSTNWQIRVTCISIWIFVHVDRMGPNSFLIILTWQNGFIEQGARSRGK